MTILPRHVSENPGVMVNLNEMIKNIYVSPYAPDWFHDIVVDLVDHYGYVFKVNMSSMTELPF